MFWSNCKHLRLCFAWRQSTNLIVPSSDADGKQLYRLQGPVFFGSTGPFSSLFAGLYSVDNSLRYFQQPKNLGKLLFDYIYFSLSSNTGFVRILHDGDVRAIQIVKSRRRVAASNQHVIPGPVLRAPTPHMRFQMWPPSSKFLTSGVCIAWSRINVGREQRERSISSRSSVERLKMSREPACLHPSSPIPPREGNQVPTIPHTFVKVERLETQRFDL
jgi:hypothetical protein